MNDPIKKAQRWDALVRSGVSEQDATAQVLREFGDGEQTRAGRFARAMSGDRTAIAPQRSSTATAAMDPHTPTGLTLAGEVKPIARALAQGATFGLADEIEAGARAPFSPQDYGEIRDDVRENNRQFASENPGVAMGAQLAGGLLTGGAALKAVGMAAAPAATAVGRIGQAAKAGAAGGGFAGFASAEGGLGDRVAQGAKGAAGGAVAGTAIAGGMEAMRAATPLFRDLLSRVNTKGDPAERARRLVAQELADDGVLAPERLSEVRDQLDDMLNTRRVSVADLAGDNTRRLANTATLTPSEQGGALRTDMAGRAAGAGRQARNSLRRATGTDGRPVVQMVDELEDARALATRPLYDDALEGVRVSDRQITDLMKRPSAAAAYRDAQRMARDAGEDLPDVGPTIARASARTRGPAMEDVAVRRPPRDVVDVEMDPRVESARRAWQQASEDAAALDAMDGLVESVAADASRTRSPNMTPAMRRKATMQGKRATDEVLSGGEKRELRLDLTEDARARIEESGMTLQEYSDMVKRGNAARRSLPKLQRELDAATGTAADAGEELVQVPGRSMVGVSDAEDAAALPTLTGRQVQWWKLALDDQLKALEGSKGGAGTTKYRQVKALRDQVDNLLYEASNPAPSGGSMYGEAQRTYADYSRQGDALRQGARGDAARGLRAFPNADAGDVEYLLRDAPEAVRKAYAKGAAAATERVVKNTRTQPAFFRAVLNDPEEQRKVRALFAPGDAGDDAFSYWLRETERDFRERMTEQAVLGNSATAGRQAAREKFGDQVADAGRGVARNGLANTLLDRGFEWYQRQRIGQAGNDVASLLRPKSPRELQELLDGLSGYYRQTMASGARSPSLGPTRAAAVSGMGLGRTNGNQRGDRP